MYNGGKITVTFSSVSINDNSSSRDGGGVCISMNTNRLANGKSVVTFRNCSIYRNEITSTRSGYNGGGISYGGTEWTDLIMEEINYIYGNSTLKGEGGGIYAADGNFTSSNVTSIYNNSSSMYGGGLYLINTEETNIDGLIYGNTCTSTFGQYGENIYVKGRNDTSITFSGWATPTGGLVCRTYGVYNSGADIILPYVEMSSGGYDFIGYATTQDGTPTWTSGTKTITASGELDAWWPIYRAKSYTVTFDANGGSVSPTSKTVTYASTYGSLPTPTRSGYTFQGWYTDKTGGTKKTSSSKVTTVNNHTLYARWYVDIPSAKSDLVYTAAEQTGIDSATGYTRSGTYKATNAGSYSATVSLSNSSNSFWSDGSTSNKTISWSIAKRPLSECTISLSTTGYDMSNSAYKYQASAIMPAVTVKIGNNTVPSGNYTLSYSNNTNAGTATVTVSAKSSGNLSGSKSQNFTIAKRPVGECSITLSQTSFTFTGQQIKPDVTVKIHGNVVPSSNYTVHYSNNINVGKGSLWISATPNGNLIDGSGTGSGNVIEFDITTRPYNIIIEENGGSNVADRTYNVSASNQAIVIEAPTRGGYTFNGYTVTKNTTNGTSTVSNKNTLNIPANAYGDITIKAEWKENIYKVNINIVSPSGAEDYKNGTISTYYSYNGQTYENISDQKISDIAYNSTIKIYNIKPAAGMMLSSVTADKGTLVNNNDGSYTYTVSMTGTPSGSWDAAIYVNMKWKQYYVDINILNPSGSQDYNSGTMDVVYSTPSQSINDVTNEASSSLIQHGGTITISDIKPAAGYYLSRVYLTNSTGSHGTLKDNGDGTYTFTASSDWTHQTQWYNEIIIQMAWKQYYVDINILNPSAEQDNKSGTMDVVYSAPSKSANDVTNEPSPSVIQHGGTITISDIKPAAGYYLSGVRLTNSSGNNGTLKDNGDGTYTFTASTDWTHQVEWYNEIIIQMACQSYTLTIDANGGSYNGSTTVTQEFGSTLQLSTPTRDGYTFIGWSLSGAGSLSDDGSTNTEFTKTIKKENNGMPYVNYYMNHTAPTSDSWWHLTHPTYSYSVNETYTIRLIIRVNNSQNFPGLGLRHAVLGNDYDTSGQVATSIDSSKVGKGWIYVEMSRRITGSSYTHAGSTYETSPRFEVYTNNLIRSDKATQIFDFDLAAISITDSKGNLVYASTYYTFGAGNGKITAQWKANDYTTTFDANGGSVSQTSKTVTYNSTYGTLPTPTRDGYTFQGWYTAKTGGTKVTSSTVVTSTSNHTLYARWYVAIPTANTGLIYNGNVQTGVKSGTGYTLSGTYQATNAGTYTATVSLSNSSNSFWSDGSTGNKTITWSIGRATISAPSAVSGLVYNGNVQTGVKSGTSYTLGGTYQATNAGNYTATATPTSNYT